MNKEILNDFLNSMVNSIEKDKIDLYKKIIENSKIENFNNPNEFYYSVLYDWDNFISGFLKVKLKANEDVEFIYKNSHYIENHFSKLIIKFEGTPCSSDKSRTIIKSLVNYYTTGNKIEFNYDGEYTYHLPKNIFKSHDDIIKFYVSLKYLYYGNNDRYLKEMEKYIEYENKNDIFNSSNMKHLSDDEIRILNNTYNKLLSDKPTKL